MIEEYDTYLKKIKLKPLLPLRGPKCAKNSQKCKKNVFKKKKIITLVTS